VFVYVVHFLTEFLRVVCGFYTGNFLIPLFSCSKTKSSSEYRPKKVSILIVAHTVTLSHAKPSAYGIILTQLFVLFVIASLLSSMKVPEGYSGPTLQILSRNLKQEEVPAFVKRVLAEVPETIQKVAIFQKDRIDGDLSQKVLDGFSERGATMIEMADFF